MISAILAISENNAIGNENGLPWPHIPEDMKWFKETTKGQIVVMGRKTWGSLGVLKPLPDRDNYVVTSQPIKNFPGAVGVLHGDDLSSALRLIEKTAGDREVIVMGGAEIYSQCFQACDTLRIAQVYGEYTGDTFLDLDPVLHDFKKVQVDDVPGVCEFQRWERQK